MKSHGTGRGPWNFAKLGKNVVIEEGVLIFHPENIEIGDDVYIGHQTILKGYYKNTMRIGAGTWIGQQCFLHSAGGITICDKVGIGPGVKILTSRHRFDNSTVPIIEQELQFLPVLVGEGCDLGVNAVILPGVAIGACTQVGAGAVVTKNWPSNSLIAGVPAKDVRHSD